MKIDFVHIIPPESGISDKMLLRYLRDEASRTETRLIDQIIEQDAVFADAVEGLMQIPVAELAIIFENLDKKLVQNIENKTPQYVTEKNSIEVENPTFQVAYRRPMQRLWWAAASVAVLFGAAIWIFTKPTPTPQELANQSVAQELPPLQSSKVQSLDTLISALPPLSNSAQNSSVAEVSSREKLPTLPSGSSVQPNSESEKPTESAKIADVAMAVPLMEEAAPIVLQNEPRSVVSESAKESKPRLKEEGMATSQGVISAKKDSETYANGQKVYSDSKAKDDVQRENTTAYAYENEKGTAKSDERVVSKPQIAKKKAAQSDPTANYSGAAAQNVMPPRSYIPPSVQQVFGRGEMFFAQKNYKEAVPIFQEVLKAEKQGETHQKAQWLLTNSYINLNKKDLARDLLNQIIKEGGQFSESAKTLILKLDK